MKPLAHFVRQYLEQFRNCPVNQQPSMTLLYDGLHRATIEYYYSRPNASDARVSRRLGISRNTLRAIRQHLNIPKPTYDRDEQQYVFNQQSASNTN